VGFSGKFPNLRRAVIRDRELNIKGVVLRNGWYEDHWSQESKSKQEKWGYEWDLVKAFFKERNVTITTSTAIARTETSIPTTQSGKLHHVIEAYCRLMAYQDGSCSCWTSWSAGVL
jgi:hypothetical protein